MRAKTSTLKILGSALALAFAHCDGTEIDGQGEQLGDADKMPWEEYMATSTMDSVQGVADAAACSTAPIAGLSAQIVAEMNCIKPGLMASISGANVSFSSAAALPYLQGPAASALIKATAGHSALPLNSTLRTVAQQWILYNWYLTGRCGVSLAAKPGQSNHEDGMAIDTSSYSSWKSILATQGFVWFGSADPVHFDHSGGVDAKGVLAFQRLWNHNHPSDLIGTDGIYGPQTEARIKISPRTGFASGASCK